MVLEQLKMSDVWRAFHLDYALTYRWEYCGKLPTRPPKRVTLEYVEAVAQRVRDNRGSIPPEAEALLEEARRAGAQATATTTTSNRKEQNDGVTRNGYESRKL